MTLLVSCSNKTKAVEEVAYGESAVIEKVPLKRLGGEVGVIPNATAFRMSGNYSGNVAITLNSDGSIKYFPAPSDISADSEPISLGEGWWLNNQGFGPHSVFTKYTFAEYAALPETPSVQQLKQAVIPGAKVTEFIELPMRITDINIEEAKEYVKNR